MDQTLRDLQRQAASGDVEAEAKLLLERVRAGDLTEEKLRLAAYLGHEPARVALGEKAPAVFQIKTDPEWELAWEFARDLRPWGRSTVLRATVAAIRSGLPTGDDLRAVLAAEDWLLNTRTPHVGVGHDSRPFLSNRPGMWLRSALQEGGNELVDVMHVERWAANTGQALDYYLRVRPENGGTMNLIPQRVQEAEAAIQAELIPWALGLSDPVRDRVEARQREGGQ